jgi:hypothetical protein
LNGDAMLGGSWIPAGRDQRSAVRIAALEATQLTATIKQCGASNFEPGEIARLPRRQLHP